MFWFISHLIIFLMIMVSVVAVNMVVAPSRPWFLLILFGWCGLLILHARNVRGFWAEDHHITYQPSQQQVGRQEQGWFVDLFSKGIRGRRGAVAVEFALILPVFLYLLVGILEVSMMFFTTTMVDGAIQDASRKIRTGQAQLSGDTLTTFQTELCSSLLGVYDCNDITLNVTTFSSFSTVSIPDIKVNGNGDVVIDDGDNPVNDANDVLYTTGFSAGGSGEITVVRITYSWNFFTPLIGGLLGDNGNSRLLSSTTVFRNEPYE